jgi:hypothetical protein
MNFGLERCCVCEEFGVEGYEGFGTQIPSTLLTMHRLFWMGGGSNHEWNKGKRNRRKKNEDQLMTGQHQGRSFARGGHSDSEDNQVYGDRVEFESVKKSLRVYRQSFEKKQEQARRTLISGSTSPTYRERRFHRRSCLYARAPPAGA